MKKTAKKTACVGCGRTEDVVDVKGRSRALTLNADGLCAVCVEVNAEAAADAQQTETQRSRT